MTEVFRLCDDYLTRWAALDPVAAGMVGLSGVFGAATDYGPDGFAAREELIATTLTALGGGAGDLGGRPAGSRLPAGTAGGPAGLASGWGAAPAAPHPDRAAQRDP